MNVVSKAFPSTAFACVDYAPAPDQTMPDNLAGLVFREEEGAFLVGAVAGAREQAKRGRLRRRHGRAAHS